MGIGPLIAWRRASWRSLGRTAAWPIAVALAAGAALLAAGAGSSIPGLLAYTFSAFVLSAIALELIRGTRARRALGAGGWAASLGSLVAANRRRYGGYVVHAAVVLLAIGVAGSSAYQTQREGRLTTGETMRVGDYTLGLRGVEARRAANATEVRAVLDVERDGRRLGTLRAGKNSYPVEEQTSNEVAIRSDLLTGEDLFVIADELRPGANSVYLRVFVKPLVNLIWLAGLVFIAGALIAMWPDAREARRLAARYAGTRAAEA
jgi:cytochrome c-type biogenesis protein CcmF